MNAAASSPDTDRDALKRAAAEPAVQLVENDMVVGLGSRASRKPREGGRSQARRAGGAARAAVVGGANPVVFCRFIATANHVAQALRKAFPKLRIEAVTGDLPSDDRRKNVSAMGTAEQRLLVATDCLSEGINLQSLFDTVVHYDLSWNPTPRLLTGEAARALLDEPASADLASVARQRLISKAIEQMAALIDGPIAAYARERAKALSSDHARVRAAATGSARVSVEPVLPADVIGLCVLVPAER
jgi:hypothetical protein